MPSIKEKYTNVYINNIERGINDKQLKKICEDITGVGSVISVALFNATNRNDSAYGFWDFATHAQAKKAVAFLNNKAFGGRKISASRAISKDKRILYRQHLNEDSPDNNVNVYVKNFDFEISEEQLRDAFAEFGTITNVRIIRDAKGNSKGFGFVSFSNHEEALNAIKAMDKKKMTNREITVAFYTPKSSSPVESPTGSLQSSPTMSPTIPDPINTTIDNSEKTLKTITSTTFSTNSAIFRPNTQKLSTPSSTPLPSEQYSEKISIVSENNSPKKSKENYTVILSNMRYVFDEKELRQYFYDVKIDNVKQVVNVRGIFTGTWEVTFESKKDMCRALDICKYLTIRNRPVYAEQYQPQESLTPCA